MRKAFLQTLTKIAQDDKDVIFLIGDVGFSYVEEFKDKFPKQFLNCGIAEQNMLGMAAGMAEEGLKPYVYTMSNFIVLRAIEQLRNDICYSNANVKLFGVKGGASYKFLGHSHNLEVGEEDAMLSFMPNLKKHTANYTPAKVEKEMLIEYHRNGPAYFSI